MPSPSKQLQTFPIYRGERQCICDDVLWPQFKAEGWSRSAAKAEAAVLAEAAEADADTEAEASRTDAAELDGGGPPPEGSPGPDDPSSVWSGP